MGLTCKGFDVLYRNIGKGLGTPDIPFVNFRRHVNVYTAAELMKEVKTVVVDEIVKALTVEPKRSAQISADPKPTDVVFKGTSEEVNDFFYKNDWTDGLPIVPPTKKKVQEFLKYTNRSPDKVLGVFTQTSNREATVWNTAVVGVMAGCRPEYMPVLLGIVDIVAQGLPFGVYTLGNTPGPEIQITLNGPIIKQLGFNYQQGALQDGFQANTSIGRFWRLYLRNIVGIRMGPGLQSDKGSFGPSGLRPVLAENEDAVKAIGWPPMSVDMGFKAGDNVVSTAACLSMDSTFSMGSAIATDTLNAIASRLRDMVVYNVDQMCGQDKPCKPQAPQLMITPTIAKALAEQGYSRDKVKQYLWEHVFVPARRFDEALPYAGKFRRGLLCALVKEGSFPPIYCKSEDPDRLIPVYPTPEALRITVSGDPGRDNVYICTPNGSHGFPTGKKIELPANWEAQMKALGNPSLAESRTW